MIEDSSDRSSIPAKQVELLIISSCTSKCVELQELQDLLSMLGTVFSILVIKWL